MTFRVEISRRAGRDLQRIYQRIDAANSSQANAWFNGLEEIILSPDERPGRGAKTPEKSRLRQVLYGKGRDTYRIIYAIDERKEVVTVIHIR